MRMRESESVSMARNANAIATIAPVALPAPMAGIVSRFVIGRSSIPSPNCDAEALAEFFEERAAIREFDGGLSREDAETLAHEDVRQQGQQP